MPTSDTNHAEATSVSRLIGRTASIAVVAHDDPETFWLFGKGVMPRITDLKTKL